MVFQILTDDLNGSLTLALSCLVRGTHGIGAAVLGTKVHDVKSHITEVVDYIDARTC